MKIGLIPVNVCVPNAQAMFGTAQLAEELGFESVSTFEHIGFDEKKNVTRKNIDWIAISRGTNVLALRNTFHSVYQLQGSAAAEHPMSTNGPQAVLARL